MPRHACCYRDKKIGDEPIQFVSLSKTWSNLNALFFSLPLSLSLPRNFQIWKRSSTRGKNSWNERNNHGGHSFFSFSRFLINFLLPFAPPIIWTTFDVSLNLKRTTKCTDNDVDFVNASRHKIENMVEYFWMDDERRGEFLFKRSVLFFAFLFLFGLPRNRRWNFIFKFLAEECEFFVITREKNWEKIFLRNEGKFRLRRGSVAEVGHNCDSIST